MILFTLELSAIKFPFSYLNLLINNELPETIKAQEKKTGKV